MNGWLHAISQIAVGGACFVIPILLLAFVAKRRDMHVPGICWLFAAFLFFCGLTRLLDAITFWWPPLRLAESIEFFTAFLSGAMIFTLILAIPKIVALKGSAQLETYVAVRPDITERKQIEEVNRELTQELERRVLERTKQLEETVQSLQRMKETLRQREERYRLVISGSNDGVWDWDIVNDKLYWNERCFEHLGLESLPNLTYEICENLLHPDDRHHVKERVLAHLKSGEPYEVECRMRHSTGDYVTILARGKAIRDEHGLAVRMAGTHTDITERIKLQEQLRDSYEKLQETVQMRHNFISTLTHDLRTPLIAQKRVLEILQNEEEYQRDPQFIRLLNGFSRNNEQLLKIINYALQTYQFEGEAIKVNLQLICLRDFVADIFEEFSIMSSSTRIDLINQVAADLHSVAVDPFLFKRVFSNLIDNAIENIPSGSRLIVHAEKIDDHILIQLEDNGPGIDPELMPFIFDKYFNCRIPKKQLGSGLGLAICKSIVELHGGTISVESSETTGTCFSIRLPGLSRHMALEERVENAVSIH